MVDWEERLNGFLKLWNHEVLKDNGKISTEMAKIHAETEFEKYRIIQDRIYVSDFDELLLNTKNLNFKPKMTLNAVITRTLRSNVRVHKFLTVK